VGAVADMARLLRKEQRGVCGAAQRAERPGRTRDEARPVRRTARAARRTAEGRGRRGVPSIRGCAWWWTAGVPSAARLGECRCRRRSDPHDGRQASVQAGGVATRRLADGQCEEFASGSRVQCRQCRECCTGAAGRGAREEHGHHKRMADDFAPC